jgi:23S rRNA G2445 N2-methylase RlmL
MSRIQNANDRNTERRIRKHIHAQKQTVECLLPAGFTELGKRFSEELIRRSADGKADETFSVKIHNGRIRIEDINFDVIHNMLIDGVIFSEIGLRILRARCPTEQKLKQILTETEWDLWLPEIHRTDIQLRVLSQSSQLYHEGKIKKAILDFFKKNHESAGQSTYDNMKPTEVELDVVLERDVLEVFVCISGRDFWKRGHKADLRHAAPLREDIAACLVRRLGELSAKHLALTTPDAVLNPFCGTGTLLHETAIHLWNCGHLMTDDSRLTYRILPFFKDKAFEHALRKKRESLTSLENASKTKFTGEDLDEGLCRNTLDWFVHANSKLNIQVQSKTLMLNSCLFHPDTLNESAGDGLWILANPPFGLRLSAQKQGGPEELYGSFAERINKILGKLKSKSIPACALVLCPNETVWKTVKRTCKEYEQECEHFTLGGLDVRAVYIFNTTFR